MNEFYNPYNFIPVTGRIGNEPSARTPYETVKDGGHPNVRHDLWAQGTRSGRVVCRLTLETPTVVGAAQVEEPGFESKRVLPYLRDGQPAIPGSSLRGMIGSMAETLSQSALRVLQSRYYSVRVPAREEVSSKCRPLSALGILVASKKDPKKFDLMPQTIPTLKTTGKTYELDDLWEKVFRDMHLDACLGAYVDGYEGRNGIISYAAESFLDLERPDSFHPSKKNYFYAKLQNLPTQKVTNEIKAGEPGLHEKIIPNQVGEVRFLLGQKILKGRDSILSEAKWSALPQGEQGKYKKGYLRVLGIEGRESTVPTTKKHEIFIPRKDTKFRIPVSENAIEKYVRLCEEREKSSIGDTPPLPFALKGNGKSNASETQPWQPRPGLIVFFDVAPDQNGFPYVCEISLSSIWRKEVDGNAHDFFRSINAPVGENLLPWNKDRVQLTPAEALFGVTGEDKKEEIESARNLASRLRFSDALPALGKHSEMLRECTLKIQSSPKPPCPAMYFHPREKLDRYIPKTSLSTSHHQPNGRKVYLSHPRVLEAATAKTEGQRNWETRTDDNKSQKLRCTPLNAGQDFFFHIDFENLSNAELTLLLTAIRPSEGFLHRLGLGKSLGLGSVALDIEGVFFIHRAERYGRSALQALYYHSVWRPDAFPQEIDWKSNYPKEAAYAAKGLQALPANEFHDEHLIDKNTLRIAETLGKPKQYMNRDIEVHTPLLDEQMTSPESREDETFKWFVENDNEGTQALPPVRAGQPLQPLCTRRPRQEPIEPNRNPPRKRGRR